MDTFDIIPTDGAVFDAQAAHDAILTREREYREELARVAENLTPTGYQSTRYAWVELNKSDEQLKELIKALEEYALRVSGVASVITQAKSTRKNLSAIHDEHWAKYLELRDANKPAPPVHTYCIRVTCTDETLGKIVKAALKAGAEDVLAASPQGDKATKQIIKWFEENV